MAVKPIPDGYQRVNSYLLVRGVAELIDFMAEAFGAQERLRLPGPEGTISHAEVTIGDSVVMLGEMPGEFAPMPGWLYLYLEDVDAAYQRALDAGASAVQKPQNQYYGDRTAGVKDEFGNIWWLSTRIEDVSTEELQRRAQERERGADTG